MKSFLGQCLGDSVLPQPHFGCVRVEDVFPVDVDYTAVQMTNCFRPGDVVKARIMSLGDARQYFLSTAAPELGVVWTRSAAGEVLVSFRAQPNFVMWSLIH